MGEIRPASVSWNVKNPRHHLTVRSDEVPVVDHQSQRVSGEIIGVDREKSLLFSSKFIDCGPLSEDFFRWHDVETKSFGFEFKQH